MTKTRAKLQLPTPSSSIMFYHLAGRGRKKQQMLNLRYLMRVGVRVRLTRERTRNRRKRLIHNLSLSLILPLLVTQARRKLQENMTLRRMKEINLNIRLPGQFKVSTLRMTVFGAVRSKIGLSWTIPRTMALKGSLYLVFTNLQVSCMNLACKTVRLPNLHIIHQSFFIPTFISSPSYNHVLSLKQMCNRTVPSTTNIPCIHTYIHR